MIRLIQKDHSKHKLLDASHEDNFKNKKKIPEPLSNNQKLNNQVEQQIQSFPQDNLKTKENDIPDLVDNLSSEIETPPKKSPRLLQSKNYSNLYSVMVPEFLVNLPNYKANHGCRRLNKMKCDNSKNFISQCSRSPHSKCNILNTIVDCRKSSSYKSYSKMVGKRFLKVSMFGASSKCINILRRRRGSVVCSAVQCDPSGNSYDIFFPDDFCKHSFWIF